MGSNLKKREQKAYWNLLKKLEGPRDETSYVPDQKLIEHFQKILNDQNAPSLSDQQNNKNGTLDYAIVQAELDLAKKILKPGKSPGIDNLTNEMITPLVEHHPELVLKLFNNILNNIWISKEWLLSIITAIHKKGAKDNPDNYRGISLMSCLGKLFLTIINNRLAKFVTDNNILSSSQLGFVKQNRTSDPHIILHTILQKYCHKKKKPIFGCFVDFSKAFDTVPRDILLSKLQNKGVNGKVFEIIRTIYGDDMASIKIGDVTC